MPSKKVFLFTTCLVDQVFPAVGAAVVKLLRRTGAEVIFPGDQVCCGQPFFNSGFIGEAKRLAKNTIGVLRDADAVVIPSGSCTAMVRHEYPKLFSTDPEMKTEAEALAAKTFELTEYLAEHSEIFKNKINPKGKSVTYHDSCHMCRGLGVRLQPRALLQAAGFEVLEMEKSDRCCGFGGVFYARMPELSQAMASKKLKYAENIGARLVVTADPGCLMRMQQDDSRKVEIRHIAELIAEELE